MLAAIARDIRLVKRKAMGVAADVGQKAAVNNIE
jgi:hypothetical protein